LISRLSTALIVFAAVASAQTAPQPATLAGYNISGVVVNHANNQPLGGVAVALNSVQVAGQGRRPRVQLSVITSSDGAFHFTNLPPGKYALAAQRRNGPVQTYLSDECCFTGIVTGPGLDTSHLVFPLPAPSRISGSVTDESGEPVAGAKVILLRKAVTNGKLEISQVGQTNTSGSGIFHFAHLSAGTYFIGVSGRPWYAEAVGGPTQKAGSEFDVAYPVTYYPDTADPNGAAPIQLSEGGSVNVQLALHAVPAVHVAVSGVDAEEANRGRGYSANVYAEGPGGLRFPVNAWMTGDGSEFELTGVPPGHYFIDLQINGNGQIERRARGEADLASGATITPAMSTAPSVAGHLTCDCSGRGDRVMIQLTGKNKQFDAYYAQVNKDGSFAFENNTVPPGVYQLQVVNAPGVYVKSISGASGTTTIQVPSGANLNLMVTAIQGASTLAGFAVKDGKAVSGAMVLLLPVGLQSSGLVRRDQSDSDGSFSMQDIVPGKYYVLAIDDGHDLAYLEPDVIKPYLTNAPTLDVTEGTNARSVQVPVQRRLGAQ
jgi:uncharacterized protein (DUF2141 family)